MLNILQDIVFLGQVGIQMWVLGKIKVEIQILPEMSVYITLPNRSLQSVTAKDKGVSIRSISLALHKTRTCLNFWPFLP